MASICIRPRSPALRPFIESLSWGQSQIPMALERILPGARVDLMVNLLEDEFRSYHGPDHSTVLRTRGAVLGGPHSLAKVIDTREMQHHLHVSFRFGGAWPFFPVPLDDASEQLVELSDLWGRDGATLRERVLAAPTVAAKFEILESVLLRHLARVEALDPAIPFAVAAFERGVSVARVTEHLGQLPKSFARRFRAQIGLSPKRFSRVLRLQRVLRSIPHASDVDWAGLAADHGFTDQAHMIHDFRELTSLTPASYRPRSAQEHNHVPVPAAVSLRAAS